MKGEVGSRFDIWSACATVDIFGPLHRSREKSETTVLCRAPGRAFPSHTNPCLFLLWREGASQPKPVNSSRTSSTRTTLLSSISQATHA